MARLAQELLRESSPHIEQTGSLLVAGSSPSSPLSDAVDDGDLLDLTRDTAADTNRRRVTNSAA